MQRSAEKKLCGLCVSALDKKNADKAVRAPGKFPQKETKKMKRQKLNFQPIKGCSSRGWR